MMNMFLLFPTALLDVESVLETSVDVGQSCDTRVHGGPQLQRQCAGGQWGQLILLDLHPACLR